MGRRSGVAQKQTSKQGRSSGPSGPLEQLRRDVQRLKKQDRATMVQEFRFAIDYLKNRQVRDVMTQLIDRFPESQAGAFGQEIKPIALPLTERYVSEAASLYNKGVRRYFVDPTTGEENEATKRQTLKLDRMLEQAHYDEVMHQNDRLVCLLSQSAVWYQCHGGKLRPVVVAPHLVYPALPAPDEITEFDASDPNDYKGFVVETQLDREDAGSSKNSTFTFLTAEQRVAYMGQVDKIDRIIDGPTANPFTWKQRVPTADGSFVEAELPLRMITFWHKSLNIDDLIEYVDCDIARCNRELNVHWSVLMDVLRFQSYATPVKNVTKKNDPGARQVHGARFPVVLDLAETFHYETAGAPYGETVQVLDHFAKFLAACKRQNPQEFSVDSPGAKATSGFAKLVDSLPKIEAREERAKRCKCMEENEAAPRIISIGVLTGDLDEEARNMGMRVDYPDIEVQRTSQERQIDLTVDMQMGLTTPAKVMAEEDGISLDEAESIVEENLKRNKELGVSMAPTAPGQPGQEAAPGQAKPGQEQKPSQLGKDQGKLYQRLINGRGKKNAEQAQ